MTRLPLPRLAAFCAILLLSGHLEPVRAASEKAGLKRFYSTVTHRAVPPRIGDPTLTSTESTENVIVHYSTADGPNQTTQDVAKKVADAMETAVQRLFPEYRPAILPPDSGGKLNVDIRDIGTADGGTDGFAIVGEAKKVASYINIHPQIVARAPGRGLTVDEMIQVVCTHECMHAVQNAYNGSMSKWFKEAQAYWAECVFTGVTNGLERQLSTPNSISLNPALPLTALTANEEHEASAAAFIHFLVEKRGTKTVRRWLQATENNDDAIAALQQVLGGKGKVFSGIYREFLVRLYQRKIRLKTVVKSPLATLPLPEVTEEPLITQLGENLTASVIPTGALFRRATPDARIPNKHLLARVEAADTGAPEMLVIKNPSRNSPLKAVTPKDDYAVIDGFKSAPDTLFILTDTTIAAEVANETSINGQIISPYINFKSVTADSPITEGETSKIRITYDLIGTPPSPPIFMVSRKIVEKNANVIDRATEDVFFFIGEDREHVLDFITFPGTPGGLYKFKIGGSVPVRSFSKKKLPKSETSIRTEIVVNGSGARPLQENSAHVEPILVAR